MHRILIADDNDANRELLEAYLVDVDCEIETSVDGADTLAKVDSFHPDLVLLDVMMPKLSGFEVCKQLKDAAATKRNPGIPELPVIPIEPICPAFAVPRLPCVPGVGGL